MLCPPSRHPSGGKYTWLPQRSPEDLPLAPLPRWLRDLAADGHGGRNTTRTPPPPRDPTGGGGWCSDQIPSTSGLDPGELFERIQDERVRRLVRDGPRPGEYPSRSEGAWHVFCALIEAGWKDEQILALFLDPANRIGDRYREKGARRAARAVADEIQRARQHVAAHAPRNCHVGIPSSADPAGRRAKSDMEDPGEDEWKTEPPVACGSTVRLFHKERHFLGKRLYCGKLSCPRCRREHTGRVQANFRERARRAGRTVWRYVIPATKLRTVEDGLARRIRAAGQQHGYVRFTRRAGNLIEVLSSVKYGYRGPGLVVEITTDEAEARLAWLLDHELQDKRQIRFSHTWALCEDRDAGWEYLADVTGADMDLIAEVTAQFFLVTTPDPDTLLAWPDEDLASSPEEEFEQVVNRWLATLLGLVDRLKQFAPAA